MCVCGNPLGEANCEGDVLIDYVDFGADNVNSRNPHGLLK